MNVTFYFAFGPEIVFSFLILTMILTCNRWVSSNNFMLTQNLVMLQCVIVVVIVFFVSHNNTTEITTDLLVQDGASRIMKNIVLVASLPLVIIVGQATKVQKVNFTEFMCLFMFSVLSLMLLISANNFMIAYLILELQSVTFYAMAGFDRSSSHSTDSSLKYFVFGAAFSCIMVFGASIVYAQTGTLNLEEIGKLYMFDNSLAMESSFNGLEMIFLGSGAVLLVLVFKLGVVPFGNWAADVYDGAPLASTISMTIIPKTSLLYFACKWMHAFSSVIELYQDLLVAFAVATIMLSTGLAIKQKRVKRLIIYSSLSQAGFLFLALVTNSLLGFTSLYVFLYAYIIGSTLIWSFLVSYYSNQAALSAFYTQKLQPLFISDFANLIRANAIQSLIVVALLFSVAGMPPSVGFMGKFWVLVALIEKHFYFISSVVVVASSFSYFYYLRLIKVLVFEIKKSRMTDGKLQPEFTDELMDAYHSLMVVGVFLVFSFSYIEPTILFAFLVYLIGYMF